MYLNIFQRKFNTIFFNNEFRMLKTITFNKNLNKNKKKQENIKKIHLKVFVLTFFKKILYSFYFNLIKELDDYRIDYKELFFGMENDLLKIVLACYYNLNRN